jgi:Fe(3+) dicitrate transport protein
MQQVVRCSWALPCLLAFQGASTVALAQSEAVQAPRVDVIGTRDAMQRLPGAATTLGAEELENARVFTTSEALRKVSGVNVRDEEGMGLRPNIGIRGLNPTRSTKVLLLEDGVPLSYAPYGDNASYYHPPIDRFERVEVLKGAGQLTFGPQTAGGVINYITPMPTYQPSGSLALTLGSRDYVNAHARYSRGNVLFDYVHKQGDGSRDNIRSQINDFNLKSVVDLGGGQALTLRANYYGENSQVTYTGITQAEWDNFGAKYNPFKNDQFASDRIGLSATHEARLSSNVVLLTSLYGAYFNRDWWRQSSNTTDDQCGAGFIAARQAGQAVNPDTCNSVQGRLRTYYTYGIEPRLRANFVGLGANNEFEFGVRAHYEIQDRRQVNGTSPGARTGTTVEDNERYVDAYSMFVQNRFIYGNWTITPAARVERILYERTNNLTAAPSTGKTSDTEFIPGIGVNWNPTPSTTLFGGVHRGFSPARVEDILGNPTTAGAPVSAIVPADHSVNAEVGARGVVARGLSYQLAVFRNYFSQQTVVGSVAGANLPLGVGETLYVGTEVGGQLDFAPTFGIKPDVFLRLAYTWLPVARTEAPFLRLDNGQPVTGSAEGNRLPYAPRNMVTLGLGYNHPVGFSGLVEMVYVSEQYGDFANTVAPSANGQAGLLDAYTIFNLALNYNLPWKGLTAFAAVKNIGDEVYIADRTRGILPGTPRLFQAGLKYSF